MSIQTSGGTGQTDPKTWALIVWGLFVASYFTALGAGLIGTIIAYVKRDDLAGTPFGSHMTYAIRTFWITLILGMICVVLSFVLIGIPLLIVLGIWHLFRVAKGLIRALDSKPIENPTGWL